MNIYNIDTVKQLSDGEPSEREHLSYKNVRQANIKVIDHVQSMLQLSYALLLLEGKLHCDEFHRIKRSFPDMRERYGYINSFVRDDNGTNTYRFGYRRPTPSGGLVRKSITMKKKGYTRDLFQQAAHDLERELCMATEEHYAVLRAAGKTFKEAMRTLRKNDVKKLYGDLEK